MTRPSSSRAFATPAIVLFASILTGLPSLAVAQQDVALAEAASPSVSSTEAPLLQKRLQVGDAARSLLELQREGRAASPTPRPLAGDVASLSYQRYLDSFKFPIPEKFSTTVQKSGSSSSSGSR